MDAWKTVISLFWSWKSVRVFAVLDLVVVVVVVVDDERPSLSLS